MKKKRTEKKPRKKMNKALTPTKTETNTVTPEGELVQKARGEKSLREFADYLNENIPAGMPGTTSFMSVSHWENGVHPVTAACLWAWKLIYAEGDPRHQLALDIFALRNESAHWVGGNYVAKLHKGDAEKILKAVQA